MKKAQIGALVVTALTLNACGPIENETLNDSDTVLVVNNSNSEDVAEVTAEPTDTSDHSIESSTDAIVESSTTEEAIPLEGDSISKLAIEKIEKTKNILLTEQFVIMVVDETPDTVTINIRENQDDKTVNYGYFKYTKSTDTLEEMDEITGEYTVISK